MHIGFRLSPLPALILLVIALGGCAASPRYASRASHAIKPQQGGVKPARAAHVDPALHQLAGIASYYGREFHGRRTASGEKLDINGMTAAHRTLPFGTWVTVTAAESGREVVVRITDRGPHVKNRVIDLTPAAAAAIGLDKQGLLRVTIEIQE